MKINREDETLINKAIDLKNRDLYQASLEILLSLEPKYTESSLVNGLIATGHYLLEEFEVSKTYFKKTTLLSPASETASLGLFHSLWELRTIREAYEELNRFLSSYEANLYQTTLQELYEQFDNSTPKYQRTIIEKYYKKYF